MGKKSKPKAYLKWNIFPFWKKAVRKAKVRKTREDHFTVKAWNVFSTYSIFPDLFAYLHM